MSSPSGDEVLTVDTQAGAAVLRSLGWTEERGGRSAGSGTDPGESSEPPRRKPGRPRKNPRPEDEATESTEG